MMLKHLKYIVLIAILLSLISCEKETKTFHYSFATLQMLTVDNDVSVRLIQDSANYIEISGPSKSVDNVIPDIQGDTITISNRKPSPDYFEEIWADIHFTDFKRLFLRNGGDVINLDTLKFSSFSISSNGAMGDVRISLNCDNLSIGISTGSLSILLEGNAKNTRIWTTAPGLVDTRNLKSENISCNNSSSNNCYVWATKKLDAKCGYLGKIFYRGLPETLIVPEGQEDYVVPLNP